MRIVFMGTPEFAIPSLKILLDNHYDVAAVVTVPDKPAGRGQHLSLSPVKMFAVQHGLDVLQPERLKDPVFVGALRNLSPDIMVVVAFRILPPEVFTIPTNGSFNLHASLLPKYRGAAPINWAIINGEKETGVTTFLLQETVDTGNIVLQARIPVDPDDTAGDVHDKLADVGAEIVLHTVRLIESGKVSPKPQDNTHATPAPKIFKEDCRINWNNGAAEIHNFIRGLSPKPGAYTIHGDTMLKLYRSRIIPQTRARSAGEIMLTDERLLVSAGTDAVEVMELQQEGKKKLSAQEFLRGYRLQSGDRFL
ncbi:MAG: methionyl-tRNA formyltransferase [Ignavibacteria bacterium]|nr:methionyl-tRNA formyltransferase [Ignavibacteria bacterium]MBI3766516.1 methionyl-tRNA formyltransferase [Ignavibacteriales bacterium]